MAQPSILATLTVGLAAGLTASAHAVDFTAVLGPSATVVDDFTLFEDPPGTFRADAIAALLSPEPSSSFTADFSAIDEFTVRLEAPTGQFFLIDPPLEFTDRRLLTIDIGTVVDVPVSTAPLTSLSFEGLTGGVPDFSGEFQVQGGGDFTFNLSATLSGSFSFSALEATYVIPNDFNEVFTDSPNIGVQIAGFLDGTRAGAPFSDPGQFITIIPEPASVTLLALGGLLVARRRDHS